MTLIKSKEFGKFRFLLLFRHKQQNLLIEILVMIKQKSNVLCSIKINEFKILIGNDDGSDGSSAQTT